MSARPGKRHAAEPGRNQGWQEATPPATGNCREAPGPQAVPSGPQPERGQRWAGAGAQQPHADGPFSAPSGGPGENPGVEGTSRPRLLGAAGPRGLELERDTPGEMRSAPRHGKASQDQPMRAPRPTEGPPPHQSQERVPPKLGAGRTCGGTADPRPPGGLQACGHAEAARGAPPSAAPQTQPCAAAAQQ